MLEFYTMPPKASIAGAPLAALFFLFHLEGGGQILLTRPTKPISALRSGAALRLATWTMPPTRARELNERPKQIQAKAMSLTVVAHIGSITIFNRVRTAQEAQNLAAERRGRGASEVRVYDDNRTFLSATALESMARQSAPAGTDGTVQDGGNKRAGRVIKI